MQHAHNFAAIVSSMVLGPYLLSTFFFFSMFSHISFFLEIEGSHLSRKVREAISHTNQGFRALLLGVAPSYGKTVCKSSRPSQAGEPLL